MTEKYWKMSQCPSLIVTNGAYAFNGALRSHCNTCYLTFRILCLVIMPCDYN